MLRILYRQRNTNPAESAFRQNRLGKTKAYLPEPRPFPWIILHQHMLNIYFFRRPRRSLDNRRGLGTIMCSVLFYSVHHGRTRVKDFKTTSFGSPSVFGDCKKSDLSEVTVLRGCRSASTFWIQLRERHHIDRRLALQLIEVVQLNSGLQFGLG